jgi:DNA-nicking Smr family endonuclease
LCSEEASGEVTVRRRRLTVEEAELWQRVARTVTPLDEERALPRAVETPPASPPATPPPTAEAAAARPARSAATAPAAQHGALDRRTHQRLRRGRIAIDARFDLHGHTQGTAHDALLRFVERARAQGCRHVLVVTGRGSEGGGILKRSVPRWLQEPTFHRHVVGFHEAGPRHGGAGALYVVLRRPRA